MKRKKRCVCGQLMPHPPVLPGTPWAWTSDSSKVPAEVVAAGHHAHEPSEHCRCAVCNSLK